MLPASISVLLSARHARHNACCQPHCTCGLRLSPLMHSVAEAVICLKGVHEYKACYCLYDRMQTRKSCRQTHTLCESGEECDAQAHARG